MSFGSTLIKGTRLTDFAQTSAEVGKPIPFGYGRFVVSGNVIFAKLPPKETRHVQKQGKGGGVKQESFTYSTSYAVAFCLGSIQGYLWIKRNGKVVYSSDPASPIDDQTYSAKWLQKATLYNGTMSQMPDSTVESVKGAGNVSAFRGLAYIVLEDDDVTEGGGAVPNYEACIIATPPEAYLTSHPYAQDVTDTVDTSATLGAVALHEALWIGHESENITYSPEFRGGYLGIALRVAIDDEHVNYAPSLVGGELKTYLHTVIDPESVNYSPTLVGGELRRQLVAYENWNENVTYSPSLVGGELKDETIAAPYVSQDANKYTDAAGNTYTDRRLP